MNLEGSVIENRYKIQEKIGNGGMATVKNVEGIIIVQKHVLVIIGE